MSSEFVKAQRHQKRLREESLKEVGGTATLEGRAFVAQWAVQDFMMDELRRGTPMQVVAASVAEICAMSVADIAYQAIMNQDPGKPRTEAIQLLVELIGKLAMKHDQGTCHSNAVLRQSVN